jgi:hypothetical protein
MATVITTRTPREVVAVVELLGRDYEGEVKEWQSLKVRLSDASLVWRYNGTASCHNVILLDAKAWEAGIDRAMARARELRPLKAVAARLELTGIEWFLEGLANAKSLHRRLTPDKARGFCWWWRDLWQLWADFWVDSRQIAVPKSFREGVIEVL